MRSRDLSRTCFLGFSTLFILCMRVPSFTQQQAQPQLGTVYVGFIQDDRRELAKEGPDDSHPVKNRVIIAAFSKDGTAWKTLDGLNQNVRWTVAFDGKNLGEVETRPNPTPGVMVNPDRVDASLTYAHAVQAILTSANSVPAIGKPGYEFAGAFETIVRRPLVVVSAPNFRDPDHWKRATAGLTELIQPVRVAFGETYQHVRQCDAQGEPLKQDWQIPRSELGIVKAYASNKDSFLIQTQLKRHQCVFGVDGKNLTDLKGTQWFFVG